MTKLEEATHADLMLTYLFVDPFTGACIWEVYPGGKAKMGEIAGTIDAEGYSKIRLLGRSIRTHRLIWFAVHGKMPVVELDHFNGDRGNNSIFNLRECTVAQNSQNKPVIASNTSGFAGVSFDRRAGKFRARIMLEGKRLCIGSFHNASDAAEAYNSFKARLHTFSPRVRSN